MKISGNLGTWNRYSKTFTGIMLLNVLSPYIQFNAQTLLQQQTHF